MNNLTIERLKEISAANDGFLGRGEGKTMADELIAIRELKGDQVPVTMDALRDAVAEMSGVPLEWKASLKVKGHQGVPFIDFNSLYRIVTKFTAPQKPVVLHDERDHYQDTDEYEQGYVRG